jgi:hypothetical protein
VHAACARFTLLVVGRDDERGTELPQRSGDERLVPSPPQPSGWTPPAEPSRDAPDRAHAASLIQRHPFLVKACLLGGAIVLWLSILAVAIGIAVAIWIAVEAVNDENGPDVFEDPAGQVCLEEHVTNQGFCP